MPAESFDLRLVVLFVAVAEAATYSAAAGELGMALPALSERIGHLEREVGAQLVDPDGRRVALTPAGRRFLVEARKIRDRAGQVAAALRPDPDAVRVHLVAAAASDELRAVIGRIVAGRPGLHLTITEGGSGEAAVALQSGDADVAFDYPHGRPAGADYTTWNRKPLVLACGPTHRLAGRAEAAWSALEGEPVFVAVPGTLDGYNATLRASLARVGVRVREVVADRVSSARYMMPRVARGDAVMILPEWAYAQLPPGLVTVPLTPTQEIEVGVSWNASTTSPAVRCFIAQLQEVAPAKAASSAGAAPEDLCP